MKKVFVLGLALLLSLGVVTEPNNVAAETEKQSLTEAEVKFANDLRRLWVDHVLWTSNYITSATTAGAEDQQQVLERLLKNQEDIGNAIKPVYGEDAGNELTELLKEHIVIAGKIVDAAKVGDQSKVDQLNEEWVKNADDIAVFLSQANPHLAKDELKKLLYMHLELVSDDLTASLQKDWEARIAAIDEGMTHIILMSDVIADGVIKQFPDKFN
ncbi:glycosyltransferase [Thalassobacillus hwangdonensis]|uniref:Glycosyltransferase n=1 Tax=Thalassobacillus hwangdonensis TaxID=546108 RepID=A0ABW3L7B7_9BACI